MMKDYVTKDDKLVVSESLQWKKGGSIEIFSLPESFPIYQSMEQEEESEIGEQSVVNHKLVYLFKINEDQNEHYKFQFKQDDSVPLELDMIPWIHNDFQSYFLS